LRGEELTSSKSESIVKALSVRQPWVFGIFHLGKDIENRDWSTKVRGRILIHASQTMTIEDRCAFRSAHGRVFNSSGECNFSELPRGCIVGSVEIADCVRISASPWFYGPYGFVLENPIIFKKPVPFKARLKFFDVADDVVSEAA
jgi:hypothetical protein